MRSCSSAQIKMADTRPPSWPASRTAGSAARTRRMSPEIPATSSSRRSRPKRNVSISVSQVRKRGHARVHIVQPFTPWVQSVGPPSSSTFHGR